MVVLDIFIGLVLVYFLYSLFVSILGELLSTWIGMRARVLRQGIDNFLNDKNPSTEKASTWLQDAFLVEPTGFKFSNAGKFYQEPTIKYLAKVGLDTRYHIRNTKPSYIEKSHFVSAIINLLLVRSIGVNEWDKIKFAVQNNTMHLQPETLTMFQNWITQSNDSYEKFKTHIGNAYEEVNDRLVGWYKRKIGLFLFIIGLILSFIMNVDTFEIVQKLADNPESRQEMVALAIDVTKSVPSGAPEKGTLTDSVYLSNLTAAYDSTLSSINKVGSVLGAGWNLKSGEKSTWAQLKTMVSKSPPWKKKFWGFIITAFALSMGSKFWFDLLKKLVSLRGAGDKPEEHKTNKTVAKEGDPVKDNGLSLNTNNPAEVVLSQHRKTWESQPGFVAANLKYKTNNEPFVSLVFEQGIEIHAMPNTLPNPLNPNGTAVPISYQTGVKGSFDNDEEEALNGALIQGSTKSWGTPAGRVIDRRTQKEVVLSCAHVIRSGKSAFIDDTRSEIKIKPLDGRKPLVLGKAKNMVLSSFCDAGIVSINQKMEGYIDHLPKIHQLRPVTYLDESSTTVTIHTLRKDPNSSQPIAVKGIINSAHEMFSFSDFPSSDLRFYDLFTIIHEDGTNKTPLTLPGDSGALITDDKEYQIGILIGTITVGGTYYSCGIKMKDIFDILQLDPIQDEKEPTPIA